MLTANEWNKKEERTIETAQEEFIVDFFLETGRLCLFEDFSEFLKTYDEDEVEFVDLDDEYDWIATFSTLGAKAFALDDQTLFEKCKDLLPEVEFRKWLKKGGYFLNN